MDNFFSQRQKEAEWKVITSQRIPIRPIIASSFPVKCNLYRIYPNQTNFLQIFLINFLSNSPKYRELLTGGTVFPQFLTAPKIVFWDSQEPGGYFSIPKQFLNIFSKSLLLPIHRLSIKFQTQIATSGTPMNFWSYLFIKFAIEINACMSNAALTNCTWRDIKWKLSVHYKCKAHYCNCKTIFCGTVWKLLKDKFIHSMFSHNQQAC